MSRGQADHRRWVRSRLQTAQAQAVSISTTNSCPSRGFVKLTPGPKPRDLSPRLALRRCLQSGSAASLCFIRLYSFAPSAVLLGEQAGAQPPPSQPSGAL